VKKVPFKYIKNFFLKCFMKICTCFLLGGLDHLMNFYYVIP
jgi:hypothetical protein